MSVVVAEVLRGLGLCVVQEGLAESVSAWGLGLCAVQVGAGSSSLGRLISGALDNKGVL